MPRLIDWGVRFELIREAVVRVAARDGAAAISVASVAAELRVSGSTLRRTVDLPDDLPHMGVAWIARQRLFPRFNLAESVERGSDEHVIAVLRRELPIDDEELDRERAWAALTAPGASDRSLQLRDEHHEFLDQLVAAALARLLPDGQHHDFEVLRVRALMDGLIAAACRGGITIEQMRAAFDRHLSEVTSRAVSSPAESPLSPSASGSPR